VLYNHGQKNYTVWDWHMLFPVTTSHLVNVYVTEFIKSLHIVGANCYKVVIKRPLSIVYNIKPMSILQHVERKNPDQ